MEKFRFLQCSVSGKLPQQYQLKQSPCNIILYEVSKTSFLIIELTRSIQKRKSLIAKLQMKSGMDEDGIAGALTSKKQNNLTPIATHNNATMEQDDESSSSNSSTPTPRSSSDTSSPSSCSSTNSTPTTTSINSSFSFAFGKNPYSEKMKLFTNPSLDPLLKVLDISNDELSSLILVKEIIESMESLASKLQIILHIVWSFQKKIVQFNLKIHFPDVKSLDLAAKELFACGIKMTGKKSIQQEKNGPLNTVNGSNVIYYRLPEPKNWSKQMVQDWLDCLFDRQNVSFAIKYEDKFKNWDGATLWKKTFQNVVDVMDQLKIEDRGDAQLLLKEFREMKKRPAYYLERKKTGKKLKEYKNSDFVEKWLQFLNLESVEDLGDKNCILSIITKRWTDEEMIQAIKAEKETEISDTEISQLVNDYKLMKDYNELMFYKKLNVKLILTEILREDKEKMLRKLISPFTAVLPDFISPSFGQFHTALVIGGLYFEFTDLGLCIPRETYSDRALIAMDVPWQFEDVENKPELLEKLAEVVAYWNANMTYSNYLRVNEGGNCQDFCEDILQRVINTSLNKLPPKSKNFLEKMRKTGHTEMEFEVSEEMQKRFGLTDKLLKFETHEQLDEFVRFLTAKNIMFSVEFPADYYLLKAFDRAFWLRHIRYENKKIYKGEYKPHKEGCPFKDPRTTDSKFGAP